MTTPDLSTMTIADWHQLGCPDVFHAHTSKGIGRWKHIRLWRVVYGGKFLGYAAKIESEEHPGSYLHHATDLQRLLALLGITDEKHGVIERGTND